MIGSLRSFKQIYYDVGRRSCKPDVVMFHLGRCGSTVLGDLLNQHPNIVWRGEMLSRFWQKYPGRYVESSVFCDDLKRTLDGLANRRIASRSQHYLGEEVKLWELDLARKELEWAMRSLPANKGLVVLLTRDNLVRKLVSSLRSMASENVFHVRADSQDGYEFGKVHINIENPAVRYNRGCVKDILKNYSRLQLEAKRICRTLGGLSLSFEEHIERNPANALRRVECYLGVPAIHDGEINYRRTGARPLSEMVANYDELAEHLSGTEFEGQLHQ